MSAVASHLESVAALQVRRLGRRPYDEALARSLDTGKTYQIDLEVSSIICAFAADTKGRTGMTRRLAEFLTLGYGVARIWANPDLPADPALLHWAKLLEPLANELPKLVEAYLPAGASTVDDDTADPGWPFLPAAESTNEADPQPTTDEGEIVVGGRPDGAFGFEGRIAEVVVCDRALSAAEIADRVMAARR